VQTFWIALERHKLMSDHQVDWNFSKEFVVNRGFTIGRQEIDERKAVTTCQFPRRFHLGRLMLVAIRTVFSNWRHSRDDRIVVF
jgi:hypothetical protein